MKSSWISSAFSGEDLGVLQGFKLVMSQCSTLRKREMLYEDRSTKVLCT